MNCHDIRELLVPCILGDIAPGSRRWRAVQAHLQACPACARQHRADRLVVQFIRDHSGEFAQALQAAEAPLAEPDRRASWHAIEQRLDRLEPQLSPYTHLTLPTN